MHFSAPITVLFAALAAASPALVARDAESNVFVSVPVEATPVEGLASRDQPPVREPVREIATDTTVPSAPSVCYSAQQILSRNVANIYSDISGLWEAGAAMAAMLPGAACKAITLAMSSTGANQPVTRAARTWVSWTHIF
jgi:hypothetical protein